MNFKFTKTGVPTQWQARLIDLAIDCALVLAVSGAMVAFTVVVS